jgi:hypothetical protein
MLASYLAAEAALLQGKQFTFEGRSLSHENLAEIRAGRKEWEQRVAAELNAKAPTIGGLGYSVARLG